MPWVMSFVGLVFAGLVVLAVCAGRLFLAVRGLGRELERAGRRLEPKRSALRLAAQRLERARE
jgi:predicted lysophospholipase L1 biosynthesis ABC-type transport system permease subunit